MSSASVVATAATENTTGKVLASSTAIKLANDSGGSGDSDNSPVTTTPGDVVAAQVVIIKAESCDLVAEPSSPVTITNGGFNTMLNSDSEGAAAPTAENGGTGGGHPTMDSLEAGVAKVAINGTNQTNRMIRVSQ